MNLGQAISIPHPPHAGTLNPSIFALSHKAFGGNQLRLLQYLLPYRSLRLDVVTLDSSLLHTLIRPLLVHSVLTLSLNGSLVPPLAAQWKLYPPFLCTASLV